MLKDYDEESEVSDYMSSWLCDLCSCSIADGVDPLPFFAYNKGVVDLTQ